MPLFVEEIGPQVLATSELANHFSQVLRDSPEQLSQLPQQAESPSTRLFQGVFNGKPVVLAVLEQHTQGWELVGLTVHPATRGRGVGTDMLRQLSQQEAQLIIPEALAALKQKAAQTDLE